jgi:hypothetical protein
MSSLVERQVGTRIAKMLQDVQHRQGYVGDVDIQRIAGQVGEPVRVIQDVVTSPPRKWARLQGKNGYLEWQCGYRPSTDAVFEGASSGQSDEHLFIKTRPDDFIQELLHIEASLTSDPAASSLSIARGLDTMLVVAAAHKSVREKRVVLINYSAGYRPEALN